jgi:hypothetical protein
MTSPDLRIVLEFGTEDRTWIRINRVDVPPFWRGLSAVPATGDVLRVGGRQFLVQGRAWEHDGTQTLLRIFLGSSHAHSDTVFG